MNTNLVGKSALVCGSTQGIGRAIAEALAQLGAEVCLLARNEEKLQEVCEGLARKHGQNHRYLFADFAQPQQVKEVVTRAIAEGLKFQILINNTGGPKPGPILEAEPEAFTAAFQAHVINSHILAQLCVPAMKEACYGRIIQVISTSVKIPIAGLGVSNTIRGAMANWSKTMSLELAAFGITVNNILPGFTQTARWDSLMAGKAAQKGVAVEEIQAEMEAGIPAMRFGTAEEVAQVAAFLATPAAAYVNGVSIQVDGGRTGSI